MRYAELRASLPRLRAAGITLTAMVGGAAAGTFTRLDGADWEAYYALLRDFLRAWQLQGADQVEEEHGGVFAEDLGVGRVDEDGGLLSTM